MWLVCRVLYGCDDLTYPFLTQADTSLIKPTRYYCTRVRTRVLHDVSMVQRDQWCHTSGMAYQGTYTCACYTRLPRR